MQSSGYLAIKPRWLRGGVKTSQSTKDEHARAQGTIQADGRLCIPDSILNTLDIMDKKAFVDIEIYGKDKIVVTIIGKWTPSKRSPGKDVVKKQ